MKEMRKIEKTFLKEGIRHDQIYLEGIIIRERGLQNWFIYLISNLRNENQCKCSCET
jgi:hypothetical protein